MGVESGLAHISRSAVRRAMRIPIAPVASGWAGSTRISGKTTRYAARNKERWKRRRTPTQDPSTGLGRTHRHALVRHSHEPLRGYDLRTRLGCHVDGGDGGTRRSGRRLSTNAHPASAPRLTHMRKDGARTRGTVWKPESYGGLRSRHFNTWDGSRSTSCVIRSDKGGGALTPAPPRRGVLAIGGGPGRLRA